MLGSHKIVIDEWAEVYDLLKSSADSTFWQWSDVVLDPDTIYVIGRVVLKENWQVITSWAAQHPGRIVFCNPAEGSQTILLQLTRLRILDHVQNGNILLITSGSLEPGYNQLSTDCYFSNIVEYLENLQAHESYPMVHHKNPKPYDFLFLNGRLRPHRKYLIDSLRELNLLDRALWTNLQATVDLAWTSQLPTAMTEPIRTLPIEYEIARAHNNLPTAVNHEFAKHHLFNNTWGDAIINPQAYVDTSFSVVTETIFDYPYSFRTEKIWKPMIMGHPFVAVANRGYYRDLKNAGFKTFSHLIDESFDLIDNPTDRINRVVDTVAHVCYNGARDFLAAAAEQCKYNYQHLREYNKQQRHLLPTQFEQYLNERSRISTTTS